MSQTPIFPYARVELFGHQQIIGTLSEMQIGGETFIRVDVPDLDATPGFTKLYGKGAIYAITPIGEATALAAMHAIQQRPFRAYDLQLPEPAKHPVYPEDSLGLEDEDGEERWE